MFFEFVCKVTESREQNKETRFFFCRDGVISPIFDGKVTEKREKCKKNACIFFCRVTNK